MSEENSTLEEEFAALCNSKKNQMRFRLALAKM